MLFSVLIPVYNVEKYIRKSVDSVLEQSEQDFEIILCDDGSTDSSGNICDEYHNKYPDIVKVIHKQNEGLLFARRTMIKVAKGEWLIHLDSDDYMMPDTLKTIKEIILKDDKLDLIICKIAYGAKDGESVDFCSRLPFKDGQVFENESKNLLYNQLVNGGYMTSVVQKIARRDIVDIEADYSRFNRVSLAEDHLQSLPILNSSKKAVFLDKPIIYYRYNDSSITKKKDFTSFSKNIRSLLDVYSEEEKYLQKWKISDETIADIAANHCRMLCTHIRNMMKNAGKDKRIKSFFDELRKNETWQNLFARADREKAGKFSRLCYSLIKCNNLFLMKVLCFLF